jgi:hypothetical protein
MTNFRCHKMTCEHLVLYISGFKRTTPEFRLQSKTRIKKAVLLLITEQLFGSDSPISYDLHTKCKNLDPN